MPTVPLRTVRPTIVAIVTPRASMTAATLRRHLLLIVAIKLALLAAIWWCFVRPARAPIGAEDAASHLLSSPGEPSK